MHAKHLLAQLLPVFLVQALLAGIACGDSQPGRPLGPGTAGLPERDNLLCWFDASDAESFPGTGPEVHLWKDRSGSGHDLTGASGAKMPIRVTEGGLSVVDARGQTMTGAGLGPSLPSYTAYCVVKSPPGNSPIVSFRPDNVAEMLAEGWTTGSRPTLFTAGGNFDGNRELEDSQWHLLTFIRDGAKRAIWVDGVLAGQGEKTDTPTNSTGLLLFAYSTAATFQGCLAELAVYGTAHDDTERVRVENYLRAKWAPLWPDQKQPLVAFVGNSITTGMYCGNGRTWTLQTAHEIPGLTSWCNVSKGGITTPQLADLATETVDPLLGGHTGANVLVFWEETNDLAVNKASAESAYQNLKDYCSARHKAGWKKILVLTVLPRMYVGADFETRRLEFNKMLLEKGSEFADGVVDVASIPELGQVADTANRDYFADGTHLTEKGNGLIAAAVAPKLQALLAE